MENRPIIIVDDVLNTGCTSSPPVGRAHAVELRQRQNLQLERDDKGVLTMS